MNLIKRIDEMIEERSLLKHPFYEMWSDGKLTLESLTGYSKEYFQLVKAVPGFINPIIEMVLIFFCCKNSYTPKPIGKANATINT